METQDHSTATNLLPLFFLALVFVVAATAAAFAHDPGLSALDLRFEKNGSTAQLTFARQDVAVLVPLDLNGDGQITQAEFETARPQLESVARGALVISLDGQSLTPSRVSVALGESNAIHFNLNFSASNGGRLMLQTRLIARLARGHRQFLTIRNEAGAIVGQKMFDANNSSFESDLVAIGHERPQTFWQFLKLGIEHILTGFDHLAFLFALLLAGGSFREAAKIITSFTVAHSITLALATLNLANLSPGIVEPMIAVSIVYVGVENIFRPATKRRWLLTFAFGLIHGFGFASVLRELGIGAQSGGAIMPLLSFNLGVELGQIAIAASVLPLIWRFRQKQVFVVRYVPACSLLIALAGSYWLIERTLLR